MTRLTEATALAARLHQAGYLEGWPPHLTAASARADCSAASESDCPVCGSGPLTLTAYHKGRSYRALLSCPNPACGHCQEV